MLDLQRDLWRAVREMRRPVTASRFWRILRGSPEDRVRALSKQLLREYRPLLGGMLFVAAWGMASTQEKSIWLERVWRTFLRKLEHAPSEAGFAACLLAVVHEYTDSPLVSRFDRKLLLFQFFPSMPDGPDKHVLSVLAFGGEGEIPPRTEWKALTGHALEAFLGHLRSQSNKVGEYTAGQAVPNSAEELFEWLFPTIP